MWKLLWFVHLYTKTASKLLYFDKQLQFHYPLQTFPPKLHGRTRSERNAHQVSSRPSVWLTLTGTHFHYGKPSYFFHEGFHSKPTPQNFCKSRSFMKFPQRPRKIENVNKVQSIALREKKACALQCVRRKRFLWLWCFRCTVSSCHDCSVKRNCVCMFGQNFDGNNGF